MPRTVQIAACAVQVSAGADTQLLPAGAFRGLDGRPEEVAAWRIDAAIAERVIARVNARAKRAVIDYEHQTLHAEKNGQPAPAAGWFGRLEWRDGQGLFSVATEWNARAKAMIEAKEYRYISPVFAYSVKTGEIMDIFHAALTNDPALDGMAEVALRAAAHFSIDQLNEEHNVNEPLKKLLAALALPETTTEADAIAAVAAMKVKAEQVEGLTTQVAALKAQTPDPAKYVPVTAMQEIQSQVATLTATLSKRDLDEIVGRALTDGKLLPAQEKWARELGATNLTALKSYIESAQALPALRSTQTGGRGPGAAASGDPVAAAKAEFEGNAALREEFIDLATYTAWKKAEAAGTVKILGRSAH